MESSKKKKVKKSSLAQIEPPPPPSPPIATHEDEIKSTKKSKKTKKVAESSLANDVSPFPPISELMSPSSWEPDYFSQAKKAAKREKGKKPSLDKAKQPDPPPVYENKDEWEDEEETEPEKPLIFYEPSDSRRTKTKARPIRTRRYFSRVFFPDTSDKRKWRPYHELLPKSKSQLLTLITRGMTEYRRERLETVHSPFSDTYTHDSMDSEEEEGSNSEYAPSTASDEEIGLPTHLLPFVPYIEKCPEDVTQEPPLIKVQKTWIDVNTIINWLQLCETQHGYPCIQERRTCPDNSWPGPILLIDVREECLMRPMPWEEYVALSYVWGQTESGRTTTENLDSLLQLGSLQGQKGIIPKAVQEAMELVRMLGKRYLWVDRFCIVQDDEESTRAQLNAMNKIYANSLFTIFSAQNEDASQGLYGVRRVSTSPPNTQSSWGFWGSRISLPQSPSRNHRQNMLDHARDLMRSTWYSRGWTFQEHLFSTRKLVFHNNTVNWECLCAAWHEAQNLVPSSDGPEREQEQPATFTVPTAQKYRSGLYLSPWPNMYRFSRLVCMYNRRTLTFPEDVLDALSGSLSALSCTFQGGFISGLPRFCFDAALLWQPWNELERRVSQRVDSSEAVLPSWSWAGWAGTLNSESWRSASAYVKEHADVGERCMWRTRSTVEWRHSETLDSKQELVSLPGLVVPEGDPAELPGGWTMHVTETGEKVYRHAGDPNQDFVSPVPITPPHTAPSAPLRSRFLHARTRRAYFKLGRSYSSTTSVCTVTEVTESGRWAGVLRLNYAAYHDHRSSHRGKRVELVEISAGSTTNQAMGEESFDEWNSPECPRHTGVYEFYNVLWVEWEEGVAYRKALGRVEKSVWERKEKEEIDLVLG